MKRAAGAKAGGAYAINRDAHRRCGHRDAPSPCRRGSYPSGMHTVRLPPCAYGNLPARCSACLRSMMKAQCCAAAVSSARLDRLASSASLRAALSSAALLLAAASSAAFAADRFALTRQALRSETPRQLVRACAALDSSRTSWTPPNVGRPIPASAAAITLRFSKPGTL